PALLMPPAKVERWSTWMPAAAAVMVPVLVMGRWKGGARVTRTPFEKTAGMVPGLVMRPGTGGTPWTEVAFAPALIRPGQRSVAELALPPATVGTQLQMAMPLKPALIVPALLTPPEKLPTSATKIPLPDAEINPVPLLVMPPAKVETRATWMPVAAAVMVPVL